jgi:hypothetical protein
MKLFIFSAQPCDSCSGLRVSNGYRTILICENLFGIKSLPILFISCTPECIQKLLLNENDNTNIPSRDSFIVNEQFISKLKMRQM